MTLLSFLVLMLPRPIDSYVAHIMFFMLPRFSAVTYLYVAHIVFFMLPRFSVLYVAQIVFFYVAQIQ